jgi:hypothetical protein
MKRNLKGRRGEGSWKEQAVLQVKIFSASSAFSAVKVMTLLFELPGGEI